MVVALTARQWTGLLAATGLQAPIEALGQRLGLDLGREGDRFRARKEITALLEPWFRARRVEDLARPFDGHGVTWSVFRSFAQAVAEDPDLSTANPMFELIEQPGIGRYLVPGTPFAFGAFAREPPRPAPVLGEHTEEILAEVVGLGEAEIARLHDDGVVAGPRR
jgi:2-methylfumaryl-CoA isomerase